MTRVRGGQVLGVCMIVCLASCRARPSAPIEIDITSVTASDFDHGKASKCSVVGDIHNRSQNRADEITFKIGRDEFDLSDIHANTSSAGVTLKEEMLGDTPAYCADVARNILRGAVKAGVIGCTMPGVAEGDCQGMVGIATTLTDADVAAVAAVETREAQAVLAPLSKALAALPANAGLDRKLDAIVWVDSQSWAQNRYDPGSLRNPTLASQADDGSARTFHADYTYNGGSAGWVKVTLYADPNRIPCVEFWDFAGSCRPLNIRSDQPIPPPPIPAPVAVPATVPDAAPAPAPAEPAADGPSSDAPAG